MPEKKYDKDAVEAHLREGSRLRKLNANPALQAHCEAFLRRNGWQKEPGKTAFETFAAWARVASEEMLNAVDREPFVDKWTREKVLHAVAERVDLGGSTPRELGQLLDSLNDADIRDQLLERQLKEDYREQLPAVRDREAFHEQARDNSERTNTIRSAYEAAERSAGPEHPARLETFATPAPEVTPAPEPSMAETLSAAWDQHAGDAGHTEET